MSTISYQDILARYGDVMAFDLLLSLEKLAKIKDEIDLSDEEARFQRALEALDRIDFSAAAAR